MEVFLNQAPEIFKKYGEERNRMRKQKRKIKWREGGMEEQREGGKNQVAKHSEEEGGRNEEQKKTAVVDIQ